MGKKHSWHHEPKQSCMDKWSLVKKVTCSATFWTEGLKIVSLVAFYYTFSITLTFYNKRFISVYPFPLSITVTHLVTKFVLAWLIREILTKYSGKERITLGWWEYCICIAPPGITSSVDIGLSNWSFEFITISLYTMTKTTVIVFIMAFSILFRLEKARCELVFVVLLIASGLFMFTFESTQFNLVGFLMVLTASFISGLRWTLAQLVLQKGELGLSHPLDMMYHIQPWMILSLLPLSASFEGLHLATSKDIFNSHDNVSLLRHMSILFGGALLAFMLELSEFLLVSRTSGLTLSIAGIVKEVFTLVLAALINGDKMTWVNLVGLFVCLCGITLHVILKSVRDNSERRLDEDSIQMLTRNGDANLEEEEDEEDEIDLFNVQRDR